MTVTGVLLFALTEFFLSLSPGPAVFLVVSQGIRVGFRRSLAGTLGILSGNAIYFALSALGIGAKACGKSGGLIESEEILNGILPLFVGDAGHARGGGRDIGGTVDRVIVVARLLGIAGRALCAVDTADAAREQ